jgi:multicomponent Na+:H+ antiporter subunit F
MTATQLLDWSTLIALMIMGVALLLSVVRICVGPTLPDRVLALDLLTVIGMGMVGAVALRTGLWLYLDIAIALALLGFLATVALARYILLRAGKGGT